ARAVIGSSFNVPPAVVPTPNMRPWMTVPAERLADSDRRVLAVINQVLPPERGLHAVQDIFAGATCFFSGVPELDSYVARQPGDYLGLQSLSTGTAAPVWPQGAGERVFAYLHADYPHVERALQALAASGASVLVHVLGDAAALVARYSGERLQFAPQLLDFRRVVAECGLCVCHGNVGTTLGMLQGGRPVLVLPKHLEHYLMGRAVTQLGAGRVVHPDDKTPDIASELGAMLADDNFRRNAAVLAQRHAGSGVGTMTDRAVARIEALALQGAGPSS
ncbi:MAG: glycosyltransferase, partial [Burkholderiales bacterium]